MRASTTTGAHTNGRTEARRLSRLVRGIAAMLGGVALAAALAPATSAAAASAAAVTAADETTVEASPWLGRDQRARWRVDRELGSATIVPDVINARAAWAGRDPSGAPNTGEGIGVALIDSGVVPVAGLDAPGKVINGPDLSFESQIPELRHLDTYGHGTHMAGIIAGRDRNYVGVAPGAHLINLKVAASDGGVDVSQIIAAIDWVVAHRNDPGLNIRVLNLSFGTVALQPYEVDPLAYAVENAWRHGITVVVAAGNDGTAGTTLTNPAINPFVIAVGASDHNGTPSVQDDRVADFSSVGNAGRSPDVVAPGRSIVSLRDPGSFIDERYPEARVGERYFRGSGTSQAAAVVSGAAALILDRYPHWTPDDVKAALQSQARHIHGSRLAQGAGQIDLSRLDRARPARTPQRYAPATGTGSLELARGGSHVSDPITGVELSGEIDIFGNPWDGASWAAATRNGTAWIGGTWNGATWTGGGWGGSSWTGLTWRSADWTGASWTGLTWRSDAWSGLTWRAGTWTGLTWRAGSWSGLTWRDATWTGLTWRSGSWSGLTWR